MLFIAIILYVVFSHAPKWILKEKYKKLENSFSWKIPLLKFSGPVLSLVLAFILTFVITISTKDSFVENKNAVYGLKFNDLMKEFGFRDSMHIKFVNGKEVERVSHIIKEIIMERRDAIVTVEFNGVQQKIILDKADKIKLMRDLDTHPIVPIMTNGKNEIKITTRNNGFPDVLKCYSTIWKQAMILINPIPKANEGTGSYISITKINNLGGFFLILSLNLMILVILNFLPLPGFSVGNFVISVIETFRKKLYNKKRKQLIGWISIAIVIALFMISIF